MLEKNLARGRLEDAEDKAQDGAFAAAALAHDDEPVERVDLERDAGEDFFPGKLELHIAQLDDMIGRFAHGKKTM